MLVVLVSCKESKEYVIQGSFDIPQTIQLGDSTIERGSLDGMYAYLIDIEGQPIDSALIEDETFVFKGTLSKDEPYFAYLLCDWGAGMLVVEAGQMEVVVGDDGVRTTGTALNEGIADLDAGLQNLQNVYYDRLLALYQSGDSLAQQQMMDIYLQEQQELAALIDSVYHEHTEDLVGVYAVNLILGQVQEVEMFDQLIEDYSDYVKNSTLMQSFRTYLLENAQTSVDGGYPFEELVPENESAE